MRVCARVYVYVCLCACEHSSELESNRLLINLPPSDTRMFVNYNILTTISGYKLPHQID